MSKSLQLQVLLKAVDQATRPFKAIQTASKSLTGDIRNTQSSIKSLDAQAAKIDGFRKASAQLAVTGQALKKAKEDAAALAIAFKNTEKPTAQQARLMEGAKRAAAELQTKYNGLRQSVQRQRDALNADGIATKNLSSEQRRLRSSAAEATVALSRQRQELQRLSLKQEQLNRISNRYQKGKAATATVRNVGAASLGVATAGLYGAAKLIAPGMEFDSQMSGTQAILGLDKNDAKLAAIRQQARDIGGSTAFSPTDVARTQDTLARSGYDADAILAATEPTVNLSLASGVDIAEAADIVTNMQSAFNLPLDQIKRVSDVMAKGFTSSNTNLLELGEAMKYVAPIAEAAGASIEDTTALLGVLADNGIKGSMAGTSTSAVFSRLQAPIGKAPEALRELGITTRDRKGNMLPVEKILKDIDRSFKKNKLGTAQQAEYLKVIFGEEAMKGAVKLVAAAGNGKLAEKQSKLKNADGTAQSIATVRMDNLDGDLKNLSSAWEDLEIEVFEKQDSALRKLTVTATDWLINAAAWAKKNPELVGTITKVTGAALALVAGLGALGLIAWPVMAGFNLLLAGAGLLGTGFSLMAGTIATALTALTWPIVAVVAAIVAGGLLIRKYWEPISAFIAGVAEGFTAAMGPISAAFEPLKPVFNWFSDKVKQLSNWFADLIKPVKATQETLDVATNAGKLFGEGLAAALSLPMNALNTLRSGIDWVLEKLGIIDTKSDGLADKVPKDNPYAGGYSPSGGLLTGGYQPVTANTGTTIVDSSVTTNDIKVSIPPGMSRQDAERMMVDALAKNERDKRARSRGQMESG
ncbi:phage tail tape measure protein [Yersinia enterocolitica]|uniref:Phage protein n=2 Tax=Yersinia enterocolitica TaxID=630 RepID=A0A0T7PAE2_YEREN|nr:phage tail tape measure protein [Yersinia enterocolitica]EKN3331626.1 phage tail tape measure protein [Yersinia enterocolitica]EKN3496975.1 phage tail tape measure protein [Yersinia enterocolitica]EKN3510254.1 phage tail tape measure protein [Yersinia enterocolitica]EKN3557914.1 phage tail tape measure protein [Yersinia enterocolitica]EKN3694101.1 phage tail tape measure protein [Yersinia enterocolitica]